MIRDEENKSQTRKQDSLNVIKTNEGRKFKFYRLSEEEFQIQDLKRKQQAGLFGYTELGQLNYPGYVTAFLDYFATGEGITRGILIARASSEAEFHLLLKDAWDE